MIPAVQRVVDRRGGPVVHVARTEGDRSGEVAQPPYPTRGVGLGTIRSLDGGRSATQEECSERACSAHDRLLVMSPAYAKAAVAHGPVAFLRGEPGDSGSAKE